MLYRCCIHRHSSSRGTIGFYRPEFVQPLPARVPCYVRFLSDVPSSAEISRTQTYASASVRRWRARVRSVAAMAVAVAAATARSARTDGTAAASAGPIAPLRIWAVQARAVLEAFAEALAAAAEARVERWEGRRGWRKRSTRFVRRAAVRRHLSSDYARSQPRPPAAARRRPAHQKPSTVWQSLIIERPLR